MEPTLKLRKIETNFLLCIICQTKTKDKMSKIGECGLQSIQTAAKLRRELLDSENAANIERLLGMTGSLLEQQVWYHRSCYEKFTNKSKIHRLFNKEKDVNDDTSVSKSCKRTLRSAVNQSSDIMLCIICQNPKDPEALRNVSTFNVDHRIEAIAQFDYDLKRRILHAFDSVAGEVKYHTYCLFNKEREISNRRPNKIDSNVSFLQLCYELHAAADKGQVLTLEAVFQRYTFLAQQVNEIVPETYVQKRGSFKKNLEQHLCTVFQFFQPINRDIHERGTLLIPNKFQHVLTTDKIYDTECTIPSYEPREGSGFHELIHAALRLRSSLKSVEPYKGLNVSREDAAAMIPEEVFLFLSVLLGGHDPLQAVEGILDGNMNESGSVETYRIQSIAQDLIFATSKGRLLTPKHIGLALTLHQNNRSKELVTLFNKAGHCASYEQVLQIDTALAEISLKSLNKDTGTVVPGNLKPALENVNTEVPVLHVTADNVDIQMDTLDGKKSLHATQMVAFQRGCQTLDSVLRAATKSKSKSLRVPPEVNKVFPSPVNFGKIEPKFLTEVKLQFFEPQEPSIGVQCAETMDAAFFLHRCNASDRMGWTEFNKNISAKDPQVSGAGYMPIILQPAHEMNTLNTVLKRCLSIADNLNHKYVVLTVDQQLYCRLLELKWNDVVYQERIVLRLGGLHLSLNYLKVIGQHMAGSGLLEAWIESGVLSETSAKKVEEGKSYKKGMRLHKLTLQALWRLVKADFDDFLMKESPEVANEILDTMHNISDLISVLRRHNISHFIEKFVESREDLNWKFWWSYMKMVSVLLHFTRSIREGVWDLYMQSLSKMLPMMARYDHHNYLKSLSLYIAEMHQLPPEIEAAFERGEFVVKRSCGLFNQVDPDHAQEWLVGDVKDSGGITGVIQNTASLQKWAITYNWRADISCKTKSMYGMTSKTDPHSELLSGRRVRDQADEDAILCVLKGFQMFDPKHSASLRNIATKDVASAEIITSLLHAEEKGYAQVHDFVLDRLIKESSSAYHRPVTLNRPLTFESLFNSRDQPKRVAERHRAKENSNVLQRVISAYHAGRAVELSSILRHELCDVPSSLFQANGSIRSGSKADLIKVVTKEVQCPKIIENHEVKSHLIIDGQALLMSIGLPQKSKTFADLADTFIQRVKSVGTGFQRIDVVFDRYDNRSIKSDTRAKRSSKSRSIRKCVDSGNVPLPKSWDNFISVPANKQDLALFLSNQIIAHNFREISVVVAGGFRTATEVASTSVEVQTEALRANHEEADTRLVLHAVHSPYQRVVVSVRDTDVFVMLIHHFESMSCKECWMMAGTSKERVYIPIHIVNKTLLKTVSKNLVAFHSVTGCDTTSFLATIGKRGAYSVFLRYSDLLSGIGAQVLTEEGLQRAEQFIVKLYNAAEHIKTSDDARLALFGKVNRPEALPPTSDALRLHLRRANYQAFIWRNAHMAELQLPDPTKNGWHDNDGQLKPTVTTLDPVPRACETLVSCGCKSGCATMMCKCRRTVDSNGESLPCIQSCRCGGLCHNGLSS